MKPNFFLSWLRNRRWLLVSSLLQDGLLLISAVAFAQYQDLALYILTLSLVLQVTMAGLDAWKEWRHTQRVELQLTNHQHHLKDSNSTLAEQTIWQGLQEAHHQLLQAQQAYQANYHEQLDYYTLWAHQVKTPLSAAQLLVEQLDPTGPLRPLLQQELFKISQYVDLVLHYLRMDTFHQDLQIESVKIQDLVNQVVKKYASFFIHKPLTLELQGLDYVYVTDRKWLELILEQLLSNAIKYTPQGTIKISIQEGILTIADTGIGIQAQDIPRVFERGFTGFNGRVSQQSSGLGLYLCKAIAANLGIGLTLKSQVGQGTQVQLDLNQAQLAQD